MIGTWMLYTVGVSALLGLAASGVELAMGTRAAARRIVWIGAMLLSAGLSASALLWPAEELVTSTFAPSYSGDVFELDPVSSDQPVERGLFDGLRELAERAEPALIGVWLAGSALMLLYGLGSAVRLRMLRRRWGTARIGGREVLVSRETGPAVVGFIASSVVMPAWVLDGDPTVRDLMLAHEQEHLNAGDPKLLLGALSLLAISPWNAPLWWQLRRLRLAIELDCDARVLHRLGDRKKYASLLLEVGSRRSSASLAVAAFAQKPSFLERRIRMITESRPQGKAVTLGAGVAAVALLMAAGGIDRPAVAFAVETDGATAVAPQAAIALENGDSVEAVRSTVPAGGAVAPVEATAALGTSLTESDTVPPPPPTEALERQWDEEGSLTNTREVQQSLVRSYPRLLLDAGVGGSIQLLMYVDAEGNVVEARVLESSGHAPLDQAALLIGATMKFSPFRLRGENVAVWINVPVSFQAGGPPSAPQPPAANNAALGAQTPVGRQLAAGVPPFPGPNPVATLTRPPALGNMTDVQRALITAYPAELRNAGVGGTVTMRLYIGADGRVVDTYPVSATHNLLSPAAETVVRMMRFRPAELNGQTVGVWVEMPINFQSPA